MANRTHFPMEGNRWNEASPALYRQSITNSALLIPIPSTRRYLPNRYVIMQPKNQIHSAA